MKKNQWNRNNQCKNNQHPLLVEEKPNTIKHKQHETKQKTKPKSHLSAFHVKGKQTEDISYLPLTVIMLQTLSNIHSLHLPSWLDYIASVYVNLHTQAFRLSIAVLPTSSLSYTRMFSRSLILLLYTLHVWDQMSPPHPHKEPDTVIQTT